MSLSRFEVRVGDKTHHFSKPGLFLQWLRGEEGTLTDVCIRGVPAQGGVGSQEVTDFIFKEMMLAKLPGKWQKRTLWYLKNRCGHRFSKGEAVCKAQEEHHREKREEESSSESLGASRSCKRMGCPAHQMMSGLASSRKAMKGGLSQRGKTYFSGNSPLGQIFTLQPTNQQQQQKQPSSPLSSLEKEAIRTSRRPWHCPLASRLPPSEWYPVWRTFHRMGDMKNKVVRCLDSCWGGGGGQTLSHLSLLLSSPYCTVWDFG